MSFNPQTLRTKLATATETADSITSIAQWILFYKRHAAAVAEQWAEALSTDENKLAQIYIANEVIQQSKNKKKGEFVVAFADVLPKALGHAYNHADLPTRDRIARVIKVWRERLVFTPEAQKEIEAVLNSRMGSPPVHSDLQLLAKKYADLQAAVATPNNSNAAKLATEVQSELALLQTKVKELTSGLPEPIKSPEIEPLSPAADNTAQDIPQDTPQYTPQDTPQGASQNIPQDFKSQDDEPETYTAKDAVASLTSQNDDVGYADSSDEDQVETGAEQEEPPSKKARVDLDPKLSSFLANISKTGM